MDDGLLQVFSESLATARSYKPGEDPTPVLEALGYALALAANAQLDALPVEERGAILECGTTALASSNAWMADHQDDAEDMDRSVAVGRAAVAWLEGRADTALDEVLGDATPPSPSRVLKMIRGELDGLSAASCAISLLRDPVARGQLQVLRMSGDSTAAHPHGQEPIRAAAAAAADMRAPFDGELIAELDRPAVEFLIFRDEDAVRLAVYAFESAPIRLVAQGVETEAMRAGYWIGRLVQPPPEKLSCDLHVGDEVWSLNLTI
jgi:hypothetical protein